MISKKLALLFLSYFLLLLVFLLFIVSAQDENMPHLKKDIPSENSTNLTTEQTGDSLKINHPDAKEEIEKVATEEKEREEEIYAPLTNRLGIQEEELIGRTSVQTTRSGSEIRKAEEPLRKSNKNLLNVLDKSEFKDYVKENNERLPFIIILSEQNVGELSESAKNRLRDKIDEEPGDNEKVHEEVREMRKEILEENKRLIATEQEDIKDKIERCGGTVTGDLSLINSVFASMNLSCLDDFSNDARVKAIYEDERIEMKLNSVSCSIGAPSWYNNNYDGSGWSVAVVDTGIDANHPALNVNYAQTFHDTARFQSGYDDDYTTTDDLVGHGTHVAGIIASQDSTYGGVGKGAGLINVKAGYLGTDGGGHMYNSDMMKGVEWAIDTAGADVISYSFGSSYMQVSDCPSCRFFDSVVDDLGIVVSISAGNDGPTSPSVGIPAISYNAFSVAALDDKGSCGTGDDAIAEYSSRGPTYDGRTKPDITAPGHKVRSTNAFWEGFPLFPSANGCNWGSLTNGWDFVDNCGTSMAAPVVSGSVPLILDFKGYRWDPKAVRALLINSANSDGIFSSKNSYGYGVLDLSEAYSDKNYVYLGQVGEGDVTFYKKILLALERRQLLSGTDM